MNFHSGTVTICTASTRTFRHRYEVTSSQAHIHPHVIACCGQYPIFQPRLISRSFTYKTSRRLWKFYIASIHQ
ncbi:hypothetical protein PUN28_014894 [Cardiocondyla obscurior]|uniref:Uncharacterized protein n=1 Tax=Cardiocondyla obscurior TaxID=286306 RepID=A0AAW2EW19_9HYME